MILAACLVFSSYLCFCSELTFCNSFLSFFLFFLSFTWNGLLFTAAVFSHLVQSPSDALSHVTLLPTTTTSFQSVLIRRQLTPSTRCLLPGLCASTF
jgi:hypothetical protein